MGVDMFNLPNILTMVRILLVPFFLNFLVYGYNDLALICYVVAGLTDVADGIVARRLGQFTKLGAMLDPLADKMLAFAAFVALTVIGVLPLWLTLSVVFRDVVIVGGCIALHMTGHKYNPGPTVLGKLTTFAQFILVTTALAGVYLDKDLAVVDWLVYFTFAAVAASGVQYVLMGLELNAAPPGEETKKESIDVR
jgi:cardiolipin synthase